MRHLPATPVAKAAGVRPSDLENPEIENNIHCGDAVGIMKKVSPSGEGLHYQRTHSNALVTAATRLVTFIFV